VAMVQNDLPGAELLKSGLEDLRAGKLSPLALALCTMAKRLASVGVDVATVDLEQAAEILMYRGLAELGEQNPHAAMNAILRRLDAYASVAEARRFRAVKT